MVRISPRVQEEVRARLLASAAQHFAKQGFDGTSIDQVALDAGVAKGTIYNYFASKENLFGDVLTEAARRTVARYSESRHGGSTRSALRALAAADVAVLREEEAFMKVLVGEALSPRGDRYALVLEHLSPFLAAVSEILEAGARTGEVRRDRAVPQLALLFVGILTLLYVQRWRSGGGWPSLEEIPDLAVGIFLDGARGPGGRSRGEPRGGSGRARS